MPALRCCAKTGRLRVPRIQAPTTRKGNELSGITCSVFLRQFWSEIARSIRRGRLGHSDCEAMFERFGDGSVLVQSHVYDTGAASGCARMRWSYGPPPVGNANYAWLEHILWHASGTAGVVLANDSLSSTQSGEDEIRRIRRAMVEADVVDS